MILNSNFNKNTLKFDTRHLIGFGSKHATNANSGIGTDFIDVLGLRLIVNPDVKPSSDKSFVYRYSLQSVEDLRHPSKEGTYLAALMVFTTLSNKSPVGNKYIMGLDPEIASTLQEIAWKTHKEFKKIFLDSSL